MIKKIRLEQLDPGMFVADFNCGWLEHPFLTNSVFVKDARTVEKIKEFGIRELYIDTKKGADVGEGHGKAREEVQKELHEELHRLVEMERTVINTVPMEEEIPHAKAVKHEAKQVVTGILHEARLGKQVELEEANHVVEKMVDSVFRNVDALASLSRIKSKDQYTFMHSVNVCVLMIAFCRFIGIDRDIIQKVGVGALLHDIGKMRVPDLVLNKPGSLTDAEFELMKSHVVHGHDILIATKGVPFEAIEVASQHHERFDGTGYPLKLDHGNISRFGKMAALADVYDAITTNRVYHKGLEPAEAIRKIYEWSKHHFDGELAQYFVKCVGIYPVGTLVRLESGLLAVVAMPGQRSMLTPTVIAVYDAAKHLRISPHEIALDGPAGERHRIIGYEDPGKFHLNPLDYLDLAGVM